MIKSYDSNSGISFYTSILLKQWYWLPLVVNNKKKLTTLILQLVFKNIQPHSSDYHKLNQNLEEVLKIIVQINIYNKF